MTYTVVTKVCDPESGGNMALALGNVFLQSGPDPLHVEPIARYIGTLAVNLRTPVFRVGEVLRLDNNDRDQFGRKPSKWDIEIEDFEDAEAAFARAFEVVA